MRPEDCYIRKHAGKLRRYRIHNSNAKHFRHEPSEGGCVMVAYCGPGSTVADAVDVIELTPYDAIKLSHMKLELLGEIPIFSLRVNHLPGPCVQEAPPLIVSPTVEPQSKVSGRLPPNPEPMPMHKSEVEPRQVRSQAEIAIVVIEYTLLFVVFSAIGAQLWK